jgi:hypothetical protein
MKNAINWFEIPVKNFDRAKRFYEAILGAPVQVMPSNPQMPPMKYGFLPFDMANGGIGGGIIEAEGYEPSQKGVLIYLNGGDDLSKPLSRVENAGGKIIMPKTAIGENGFMAQFIDTEGNKVAFHSMK